MDFDRYCKLVSFASLGLVLLVAGCRKTPHITLACAATPPAVYQGEPVRVNATAGSVSAKKHTNVLYKWSGTGVTGDGATATVSTGSLDPGTYAVNAEVMEGKRGKEGRRPEETATCSTNFKIKEFEPPTASCSADRLTLLPGGSSNISCTGVSPQNRPLTYTYSASAGNISGTGTAAVFSAAANAPAGPVTVTCDVQDDKNHATTAEVALTVQAPPLPPMPHVQALCSLSFERDKKRPTRVSNEAKACLDEIALDLEANPDAKMVLVADSTAKEKETTAKQESRVGKNKHAKVRYFAEQRAVNAKDYLVREKGIDPSRIAIATGPGDDQNVGDYLVPGGASFSDDVQGTSWINESAFTAEERKPLPLRPRGGNPAE
jgi:pyruvate/2-oxoglutarate dehydrogenase complex dihydrolipoamide acyltransferase (E2) component